MLINRVLWTVAALVLVATVAQAELIHHWNLNENGGTAANDSIGTAHGTLVGNDISWYNPGVSGSAIQLVQAASGGGGYPTAADGSAIQLPNGILNRGISTIQMDLNWDYSTQGPYPGDGFCGYLFTDGNNEFARAFIDDSTNPWRCKLQFGVSTYGGWKVMTVPSEFSLQAGVWTNVAFTREGDSSYTDLSIYVDGELAAFEHFDSGGIVGGGATYIGLAGAGASSWGGQVDNIGLYNEVVPEPATIGLIGLGSLLLRRKRK